jgi:hypothetical protein
MRSWKTTTCGLISAGAAWVLFAATNGVILPHWMVVTASFVLAGGLAGMGVYGKDYNVTGAGAPPNADKASK